MKFRQHIRVYGYPDILKHRIPTKRPAALNIEGVGAINLVSRDKATKMRNLLEKHGIKYTNTGTTDSIRVKYLLSGQGVNKAIRGKMFRGDILYTIESNDERELLDKRDAALKELESLKVKYEDVCKWVCETAPKMETKKIFRRKTTPALNDIATEQKQLSNTVADLRDKIQALEKPILIKSMNNERKARAEVLR